MKFEWEQINISKNSASERVKVINGWIVRMVSWSHTESHTSFSESSVFIPDAKHEWEIDRV